MYFQLLKKPTPLAVFLRTSGLEDVQTNFYENPYEEFVDILKFETRREMEVLGHTHTYKCI